MAIDFISNSTQTNSLALTAKGQISYYTTSTVALNVSTVAGQKIVVSSGTSPSWTAQSTNGIEVLNQAFSVNPSTLTQPGSSQIAYLTNIPQTYKHLLLRLRLVSTGSQTPSISLIDARNSSSSTLNSSYNEIYSNLYQVSGQTTFPNNNASGATTIDYTANTTSGGSTRSLAGSQLEVGAQYWDTADISYDWGHLEILFLNYSSTSKYKPFISRGFGARPASGSINTYYYFKYGGGVITSTDAVTNIKFQTGTTIGGRITVYGIS